MLISGCGAREGVEGAEIKSRRKGYGRGGVLIDGFGIGWKVDDWWTDVSFLYNDSHKLLFPCLAAKMQAPKAYRISTLREGMLR